MVDIHVSVYIIIHLSLTYVIQTLKSLLQRKYIGHVLYVFESFISLLATQTASMMMGESKKSSIPPLYSVVPSCTPLKVSLFALGQ